MKSIREQKFPESTSISISVSAIAVHRLAEANSDQAIRLEHAQHPIECSDGLRQIVFRVG